MAGGEALFSGAGAGFESSSLQPKRLVAKRKKRGVRSPRAIQGRARGHLESAAAIDDEAVRKIVRRYSNANAVSRKHANMVTAHTAGQLGADNGATLINSDCVLSTAQSVLDDALHLQ
jgi:hypothetical protein